MNSQETNSEANPEFDVRKFTTQAVMRVFDTMLNYPVEPLPTAPPMPGRRVSSFVAWVGETVVGEIYLHMTVPFAMQATAAMQRLEIGQLCTNEEVTDAAGELINMIGGSLKSRLCNAGYTCRMSSPSVLRAADMEVESTAGSGLQLGFNCRSHCVVAEVYIKFN
jgi:chemotaxis protein CheX